MQYGLIFCLYVSTWCIDLLRYQALHIVISKLPLKYETWFPSRSMTAQAISHCFFGISNIGDCAAVRVSALGSQLSTSKLPSGCMPWEAVVFWATPALSCLMSNNLGHPWTCRRSLQDWAIAWNSVLSIYSLSLRWLKFVWIHMFGYGWPFCSALAFKAVPASLGMCIMETPLVGKV